MFPTLTEEGRSRIPGEVAIRTVHGPTNASTAVTAMLQFFDSSFTTFALSDLYGLTEDNERIPP
jgi:hypothetical protein